jgi:hypothetical protein
MENRTNFGDKSVESVEPGDRKRSTVQVHPLRAIFLGKT